MRKILPLVIPLILGAVLSSIPAQAEKILIIGDSHTCRSFGSRLLTGLAAMTNVDNQVTLFCTPSSTSKHWIRGTNPDGHSCYTMTSAAPKLVDCAGGGATPKIETLLKAHKGSRVIIALGTNSLGDPGFSSFHKDIVDAVKKSGGPCVWIGPPHMNPSGAKDGFTVEGLTYAESNLNRFYKLLKTTVEPTCSLVDSRPLTAAGTPGFPNVDGVHREDAAGVYWAGSLQNSVIESASAPASEDPGAVR